MTASEEVVFVGREAELRSIVEAARLARERRPGIVWIEGEAGIGKSSLVRHVLAHEVFDDFTVLRASCEESQVDFAYHVIDQLVSRVSGATRRRFSALTATVPSTLTPVQVGSQLLGLVGELQSEGPVVLVVDDAQWTDRTSLQALGFLLRRLEADSVLTLVLTRHPPDADSFVPVEQIAKLVRDRGGRHHLLPGLTRKETEQLACQTGSDTITPRLVDRLQDLTAGHPLYLQTLLNHMPLGNVTCPEGLDIPPSLTEAIGLQLASLPDDARRLVEACAVLDSRLPVATVARVADVRDGLSALEPLLREGLAGRTIAGPITSMEIRNALQREVILRLTPSPRRCALHTAAAEAVDEYSAWRHLVAASEGNENPRLAAALESAASNLVAEGDLGRAATLLQWACDLTADRDESERLLLNAAVRLHFNLQFTRYSALRSRVERCRPSPLRNLVMGWTAMFEGDLSGARELMMSALDAQPDDSAVGRLALVSTAALSHFTGSPRQAIDSAERLLAVPGLDPQSKHLACAASSGGAAFLHGPQAAVERLNEFGLPERVENTPPMDALPLAWRGLYRVLAGDLRTGITEARRSLALTRHSSVPSIDDVAHFSLALSLFLEGAWDEAAVHADQTSSIAFTQEKVWSYALAHTAGAVIASARGDWPRAEKRIQDLDDAVRIYGPDQYLVYTAIARGTLAQAQNDPAAMYECLRPLLDLDDLAGWPNLYRSWWLPLLCEALVATARYREAAVALDEVGSLDVPYLVLCEARFRGLLAERTGDTAEALRHYRDGIQANVPENVPVHRGLLEYSYGRLLSAEGRRSEAAEFLQRAKARFVALGAKPYLKNFEPLEASGALDASPSAGSMDTEYESMTLREREISRLIGRGLTNNEIASELFLSPKTVEYHLGNVYAKLQLSGRRRLRDLVNSREPSG
ncbi:AAA family ATPase [Streptomyces sp. NPDC047981]|uniref:helix-turn-helix transcriptional regulator n=1 Tax=Streptomyces sp. NPDC047981 TaxID=3154610 RepID=UPI003434B04A